MREGEVISSDTITGLANALGISSNNLFAQKYAAFKRGASEFVCLGYVIHLGTPGKTESGPSVMRTGFPLLKHHVVFQSGVWR